MNVISRAGNMLVSSVCILLLLTLLSCSANKSSIPKRPDALGLEQLAFEIPEVEKHVLSNGLKVYLLYDEELPVVRGRLYFRGGSLHEPLELSGLASAHGSQLREGGTKSYSPEHLDKRLNELAAVVESGSGEEFGTVSFFALREDFSEVFDIFAEVLRKPRFQQKRLEIWRTRAYESIRRRREDPSTMASMAFAQLNYGEDSAYGSSALPSTVAKIGRREMLDFHEKHLLPNRATLTISGAIKWRDLEPHLLRNLSDWQPLESSESFEPSTGEAAAPGVYVLERDFQQASIVIGHRGPARLSKDMYAISLYNRLFGHSGFDSLLFAEIRSKLGLAYDVSGGFLPAYNTGVFRIDIGTRSEQALQAVAKALELYDESRVQAPKSPALQNAQQALQRSFVFKFDRSGKIVNRKAVLDLLGYPKDYDAQYLNRINSVKAQDILHAARGHLDSEKLYIVLVGKFSEKEVLASLGSERDIYRLDFDNAPRIKGKLN